MNHHKKSARKSNMANATSKTGRKLISKRAISAAAGGAPLADDGGATSTRATTPPLTGAADLVSRKRL